MASEGIMADEATAGERNHENDDAVQNHRTHPRVSAKKTFHDIHRNRRSAINVVTSESEVSSHPRIHWSAGTTEVGSRDQSQSYDESPIRDPTIQILQSEVEDNDSIRGLRGPKRDLPPEPETWGAIDAQPTQPEEIEHLMIPSVVLNKTDITKGKKTKAREKFLEKFRSRATSVIAAKRFESKTAQDPKLSEAANDAGVSPEEEFKLLNESYIREGILRIDDLPRDSNPPPDPRTSALKVKGPRMNSSVDDFNREPGISTSVEGGNDCFRLGPSNASPLPARRSCEPMDVNDLRKLRDSAPRAGTTSADRKSRDRHESDPTGIENDILETETPRISILSPENYVKTIEIGRFDSEESLDETNNDGGRIIDRFKIDNPFSDFSLHNINRDKIPPKPYTTGTKHISVYLDPAQPGTSKDSSSIEAYRRKVSFSDEIIETPESPGTLDQASWQPASSDTGETSFLDKAVTRESSKTILGPVSSADMAEEPTKKFEIARTGDSCPAIPRILGENFIWSDLTLIHYEIDSWRGGAVLNCWDPNFEDFLKPLIADIVRPTFEHLLQNFLSNLTPEYVERPHHLFPTIDHNSSLPEATSLLWTARFIDITDVVKVSRTPIKGCADYLAGLEEDGLCRVAETLENPQDRETDLLFHLPREARHALPLRGSLMENVTRYVADIILSQNLDRECLSSSFGPMGAFGGLKFWAFRSVSENHRSFFDGLGSSTAFLVILENLLNPRRISRKR